MYTDNQRYQDVCQPFIDLGLITGITRELKRGKEGSILLCGARESMEQEFCIVKMYREAQFRNFKNDHKYLGGRVWDRRTLMHMHAIKDNLWVETEFSVLKKLHAAGARVPRPYDIVDTAICMEFLGIDDRPADMLKDCHFNEEEARRVFDELILQLDQMLYNEVIHSDLSPFNILYHNEQPVIIDFPQAVHPETNSNAFALFRHDIRTLCDFFSKFGLVLDEYALIEDTWGRYYRIDWSEGV